MDVAREALQSLRSHFEFVYTSLEHDKGRAFTHIAALPLPVHNEWRFVFLMELWTCAIDNDASEAFHSLALHTPADMLENALDLVVRAHERRAVIPLMACLERRDGWNRHDRLRMIQCGVKGCQQCRDIRAHLLQFFDLEADWTLCRTKLAEARRRKLWTMWQPSLALHPATDVVFARIKSKSKRNLNLFVVAALMVGMWRRWMKRRLHPDSSFVLDFLATRWQAMSVRTWLPSVSGWGGEVIEVDE